MSEKKLKDYFPDAIAGDGLFSEIANIEWFAGLSPSAFDTYFALTAGDKIARSILDNYADADGHITGDNLKALAKVIYNVNIISWRNIYRDLTVKYNPIENTDFVETIKDHSSSSGETSSESEASGENSSETDNSRYGFNSSTAAPERKDEISGSDSSSGSSSASTSTEGTYEREYRKHGNIGVTTNAQMITSDLEVWKNKCADYFIRDICELIALSIY